MVRAPLRIWRIRLGKFVLCIEDTKTKSYLGNVPEGGNKSVYYLALVVTVPLMSLLYCGVMCSGKGEVQWVETRLFMRVNRAGFYCA